MKTLTTLLSVSLLTGCVAPAPQSARVPKPAPPSSQPARVDMPVANPAFDPVRRDLDRLNRILGISAQTYVFTLNPDETLIVTAHSQRNGVDEPADTFSRVVDYKTYQDYPPNYPSSDTPKSLRLIDVEIQEPGRSWNPDLIKVSLRFPGQDRYFYFAKPSSMSTRFDKDRRIFPGPPKLLLEIECQENPGTLRTLSILAQIRPKETLTPERKAE